MRLYTVTMHYITFILNNFRNNRNKFYNIFLSSSYSKQTIHAALIKAVLPHYPKCKQKLTKYFVKQGTE